MRKSIKKADKNDKKGFSALIKLLSQYCLLLAAGGCDAVDEAVKQNYSCYGEAYIFKPGVNKQ